MDELKFFVEEKLDHGIIPNFTQFLEKFYDDNDLPKDELRIRFNHLLSLEKLKTILETPGLEELKFISNKYVRIKTYSIVYNKDFSFKENELKRICQLILIKEEKKLNDKSPFCSFTTTLFDKKVRVTLVKNYEDPSLKFLLTIRVFNDQPFHLSNFELTDESIQLITKSVLSKENILISGKTGSGKTSFLQSLVQHANKKNEHIILVEDLKEIPLFSENIFRLATSDHQRPMDELISWALRLSPDRLVIGEVRSLEAVSFLNILNTGHQGAMTTIHANGAVDAIDRLAFLINFYHHENLKSSSLEIKKSLSNYINLIIHVEEKRVTQMIKIKGTSKEGALYYQNLI